MSLLHLIKQQSKSARLLLILSLFVFINLLFAASAQYFKLAQLATYSIMLQQPAADAANAVWLSAVPEQLPEVSLQPLPQKRYQIYHSASGVIFVDNNLLNVAAAWHYVLLNLITGLFIFGLLRYLSFKRRALFDEVIQLDQAVEQLQQRLQIHASDDSAQASVILTKVDERLAHFVRQDQELRHLVRVQGLIDHELAIGNRIFFESKLQHYLGDHSEQVSGALFIIQLSHPERAVTTPVKVARLKACVELIGVQLEQYADTVIARLSENDLALLIAGMTVKDMTQFADKLALLLSRADCFRDCEGADMIHIGYVAYQRGQSSYQLLSEADMALKSAQLQGPNAAFGFQTADKPAVKGSVWWRSEISKALQQKRFSLSFQPVFSWHDKEVLQQEVLVRLQSSEGTIIPAAVFLPMAFNCGLNLQIDQYVLLHTAKLIAVESRSKLRCSINLSSQSLLDTEWRQWLTQMVLSGQIDPAQLALEITEHQLVKHYSRLKSILPAISKMGFALIIDHVGLAIDSVAFTEDIAVDAIKLHPSVVRNIDQHLEQQLFVRGLIANYAEKGIRVFATGVELTAEWQVLQKLGVAGGQGYYFSQPLAQIITHNQPG
ncbi:EAL domain-containing protein [Arsukibacterium sp.]|uniref:EAL domain-containing protein n=1 Tax=Arsukibacterium sp. TaxID=1977258 RepID=UPI002FD8E674